MRKLLLITFLMVLIPFYQKPAHASACTEPEPMLCEPTNVNTMPTLTVQNVFPMYITSQDRPDWLSYATASDYEDGNITSRIDYTTNINYSVSGTYWLKYYVTDTGGNYVSKTVNVNVTVLQGA